MYYERRSFRPTRPEATRQSPGFRGGSTPSNLRNLTAMSTNPEGSRPVKVERLAWQNWPCCRFSQCRNRPCHWVLSGGTELLEPARADTITWAHQWPVLGLVLVCATVAAMAAFAAWLVRRSGQPAAGSGIPHVEAVIEGSCPPRRCYCCPSNSSVACWPSGVVTLGREGPSVQMGANLAQFLGKNCRLPDTDRIALSQPVPVPGWPWPSLAPMAGAIFVLEELVRRFDVRIAIAALGTSCSAIAVASLLLGEQPDFNVEKLPIPASGPGPSLPYWEILAGLAGVAYNQLIIKTSRCLTVWPVGDRRFRHSCSVHWWVRSMVCPAHGRRRRYHFQQALVGGFALAAFPVFAVRFLLGPLSYAADTPGPVAPISRWALAWARDLVCCAHSLWQIPVPPQPPSRSPGWRLF